MSPLPRQTSAAAGSPGSGGPLGALLPHAALFTAMFIWSTSFIALKIALSGFGPLQVMGGRMTVAALAFLPLWPTLWRALRTQGRWRALALMVVCEPCLYFLCEIYALRYTSAAQAGMIVAMLPLCVAVAAWVVLRERTSPRVWLGFAMALSGGVWLSMGAVHTENAPQPVLGNALEALAMCCATAYTISVKRLSSSYTPMQLTACQSTTGMGFFVPLALLTAGGNALPLAASLPVLPHWAPLAAVVYLGGLVTFGGYGLYNFGLSRLPAAQASAYTNLIPVMTLGMGLFWLDEVFVPMQYAASALVVLGVILSQMRGKG